MLKKQLVHAAAPLIQEFHRAQGVNCLIHQAYGFLIVWPNALTYRDLKHNVTPEIFVSERLQSQNLIGFKWRFFGRIAWKQQLPKEEVFRLMMQLKEEANAVLQLMGLPLIDIQPCGPNKEYLLVMKYDYGNPIEWSRKLQRVLELVNDIYRKKGGVRSQVFALLQAMEPLVEATM